MTDPLSKFVARFTPLFLILFAVGAIIATAMDNGPVIENTYYASWLIVAAALLVRLDKYLEAAE